MQLKLTLARPGAAASDLVVSTDPTATVGEIAEAITRRDPHRASGPTDNVTLRVDGPGPTRILQADKALADAALQSGDQISVIAVQSGYLDAADERAAAAVVVAEQGPDAGKTFQLASGANLLGRDPTSQVPLGDPMVSKRHARINVGETLEVIDLGSVNGVEVGGVLVDRATLRPGDRIRLGETVLAVQHHRPGGAELSGTEVAFNRSPYLDPRYEGVKLEAPDVPQPPKPQPFPVVAMVAPLFFGVILYVFTHQLLSVIFTALSPVMMIGMYISTRLTAKRELEAATRQFYGSLDHLRARLDEDRAEEAAMRRREQVSVTEVLQAAAGRANLLWARRPDRHGFLELRLGLASLPTRSSVEMPPAKQAIPELYEELAAAVQQRAVVGPVPVVAPLTEIGALGIAGVRADALAAARGVVAQVAGLHSPAEVVLAAVTPAASAADWDWLKWLPHTSSSHSPVDVPLLGSGPGSCARLTAALADLIEARRAAAHGTDADGRSAGVQVVVVVEDDAPVERPRLVALAEQGREAGVYVVWVASSTSRLPAACEIFFTHDPASHTVATGFIEGGVTVVPVAAEPLAAEAALAFARDLAPVVDASAATDDAADVPQRVSFLAEAGVDLAASPDAVIDRWRQSDSLPLVGAEVAAAPKRRNQTLHAFIGASAHGSLSLDLRTQGPHALVGGTTGAGKSEFLQSWIMGLATTHSPSRVTFLFVDYKGGAAFSECVKLPHTVGLVTDLTPHLVHRALRSLNAELQYREHILNEKKAKDVLELEADRDPDCPPSLVIVVDEFAALVAEVPEFVDGVVNVAQRGRSLGLHLILATQRPAGVIKDNLRANTNLRVALRMADEEDSDDVVGTKLAATFDPSIPGRGVAKTGPGRLTLFQSAYVGGWTKAVAPRPPVMLSDLVVGVGAEWEEPEADQAATKQRAKEDAGPNDLKRLVASTVAAADRARIAEPRKPWLAELAPVYDLAKTPLTRTDTELVFGIADDPDHQQQAPISFDPDRDGNMSVIGTGGSGKSAFLRTLATVAGLSTKGGPCHVYGLDFASRGLHMLEVLPHVGSVVNGDDDERVNRLLRSLRELIDERAERYAKVRAGSITDYRRDANEPDEPRILVLLDGVAAFRQAHDTGAVGNASDALTAIAAEGRPVGVHVVVSADRPGAIPSALGSVIQRRLTLRLASDEDYAYVDVPKGALGPKSPPGRGFVDDHEVQVVVLGGSASVSHQARALTKLGQDLELQLGRASAPAVGRLPELVALSTLPAHDDVDGIVIGLADRTLGPANLTLDAPLLVTGPPGSGRTTTLVTLAAALERRYPGLRSVCIAPASSDLQLGWSWAASIDPSDPKGVQALRDFLEAVLADQRHDTEVAFFVDNANQYGSTEAAEPLKQLLAAAAKNGYAVVAECDVDGAKDYSDLVKFLRAPRFGIALSPDSSDCESIYRTTIPRLRTRVFPLGRGLVIRRGVSELVQVAVPWPVQPDGEFSP